MTMPRTTKNADPASLPPDDTVVPPGHNRVAWILNMTVNPLTVAPALFALVVLHEGKGDVLDSVILAAMLGYVALPLVFLMALKKMGRIASIEARDRKRRAPALWIGAGLLTLAGAGVTWAAGAGYGPVAAVAGVLAFNAFISAGINERFKLSLHVASVSGAFSILTVLVLLSGRGMPGGVVTIVLAGLLIPILMWARLADGAHTRKEVLAGGLFGLFMPAFELWILDALWLLYG